MSRSFGIGPCSSSYWLADVFGGGPVPTSPEHALGPALPMKLDDYFQVVVDFERIHEAWAAPIVFALAFGESLAFISLLIPAWGALVAIGALMGVSGIAFVPVWVAGSLGAACGDWLFYWLRA